MSAHCISMTAAAVEIRGLTRRFGATVALDDVSLRLPEGTVLGLVGENGAGKTTLIKHVLGLLRAQRGSVRVFGRDPVADPVGVLSRIGYLSEEADLPGWMRVGELMGYCEALYPTWDPGYASDLQAEFDLNSAATIRNLSKGQRARVGLLVALAYRPDLLVLDEPSSGLDPVVRQDILTAIIRTIADEGRTVLFSSHLLSEVERVADEVAMVQRGRILFCDPVSDIKGAHCRVILRFGSPRAAPPALEGVLAWEGAGREWEALCSSSLEQVEAAATILGAQIVRQSPLSLDEIFMARVTAHAAGQRNRPSAGEDC